MHLIGNRFWWCDEHFMRHALGVCGVNGHHNSGKDVQVICLRRQERLTVKMDWRKLHTTRINRFAFRPGVRVGRQTLVFLDGVRQGENNWPGIMPRHRLNDFLREEFCHCAYSDEDGRLEVLDGCEDLRVLRRQIERIERFAGPQMMRISTFGFPQPQAPSNYKALRVNQSDLSPRYIFRNTLLN